MTTAAWIGVACVALFFILSLMGMKVAYSLLASGIVGLVLIKGLNTAVGVVGTALFSLVSSYDYAVLPMFVLMATIITVTGLGSELYSSCRTWLGHMHGGLCIATIIACAIFAAVTAFPWASIMAVGAIALPEMKKYGYSPRMAVGSVAAGAELGDLIPPSSMFIIYGMISGTSIGALLMAGIVPGIITAALYCVVIMIWCKKNPNAGPRGPKTTAKEKLIALKNVWPIIAVIFFVMASIIIGICTPTEAGAIGATLAFLIALIQKRMSLKIFKKIVCESASLTGLIYLIIACAMIMKQMIAMSGLPYVMSDAVTAMHLPNILLVLLILVVYIILGMFVEVQSMILLTVGIFLPIVQACGFSAVWFGVILVRMGDIAGLTPPMGMTAFFLKGMAKMELKETFRGCYPYLVADAVSLALLVAFPQICEWLPVALQYGLN